MGICTIPLHVSLLEGCIPCGHHLQGVLSYLPSPVNPLSWSSTRIGCFYVQFLSSPKCGIRFSYKWGYHSPLLSACPGVGPPLSGFCPSCACLPCHHSFRRSFLRVCRWYWTPTDLRVEILHSASHSLHKGLLGSTARGFSLSGLQGRSPFLSFTSFIPWHLRMPAWGVMYYRQLCNRLFAWLTLSTVFCFSPAWDCFGTSHGAVSPNDINKKIGFFFYTP